jgi:hypothetical protein
VLNLNGGGRLFLDSAVLLARRAETKQASFNCTNKTVPEEGGFQVRTCSLIRRNETSA